MPGLVALGLGFAGVIVVGTVAVAVNDVLESWVARLGTDRSRDGGESAPIVDLPHGKRVEATPRQGLLVERTGARAVVRGERARVPDAYREPPARPGGLRT